MSNKRKVYYRGMVDGVHRARHDVSLLLPQLIREVRNPTDDLDDHELVDDFVSSLDLLVWKIEEECFNERDVRPQPIDHTTARS